MQHIVKELSKYSRHQLEIWVSKVSNEYVGKSLRFILKGVRGVSKLLASLDYRFQRLREILTILLDKLTYLLQGVVG